MFVLIVLFSKGFFVREEYFLGFLNSNNRHDFNEYLEQAFELLIPLVNLCDIEMMFTQFFADISKNKHEVGLDIIRHIGQIGSIGSHSFKQNFLSNFSGQQTILISHKDLIQSLFGNIIQAIHI